MESTNKPSLRFPGTLGAGLGGPQTVQRQVKLADQVYEKILREIVLGELAEGQRLPSETELCQTFGVSRPILREALARLKADGVLIARQGSGNYIQRRPEADFFRYASDGNIAIALRCFEYRIAVEAEAAGLAAERRTPGDLKAIGKALDELDRATLAGEVGNGPDFAFHLAISAASQNDFFVSTMWNLHGAMDIGVTIARNLSLQKSVARTQRVQQEHEAIYDAIARGEPDQARQAMKAHISQARARMLSREPN